MKKKSFLAIIPARGGSKRLPRKNILDLNGKPLIAWSIEASLNCDYINETLVTSDDDEILNISQKYGAHIIKRPDDLASDTASSFDAIKHAIDSSTIDYEYIVLLQPTSPLRNSRHINEAINLLEEKNADAIISVCEMEHSPLWSNTIPDNNSMQDFLLDSIKNLRSQDLPTYYRLNGAIYICKKNILLEENSFFIKENIYAYKMGTNKSIDIDTYQDFQYAEFLMKGLSHNGL